MLDIPYVGNPGMACALSCYTMVAKYFFPDVTFEDISKISEWKPGYVVWGFKFRIWMLEKGFEIRHIEDMDYQFWAENGIEGLKQITAPEEFAYVSKNTYDLESYDEDIRKMFTYDNFHFIQKVATWNDLETAFNNDEICVLTLNCEVLDKKSGYDLHAVVVVDITSTSIIFHDPRGKGNEKSYRKESHDLFQKSFEGVPGAELVTYKKYETN